MPPGAALLVRSRCAHFWHCGEQSARMDGVKLSISSRKYHSILQKIPGKHNRGRRPGREPQTSWSGWRKSKLLSYLQMRPERPNSLTLILLDAKQSKCGLDGSWGRMMLNLYLKSLDRYFQPRRRSQARIYHQMETCWRVCNNLGSSCSSPLFSSRRRKVCLCRIGAACVDGPRGG